MSKICNKLLKLIMIFTILSFATNAIAANLVWNPSTGVVDGYKVYYGTNASNPSNSINAGSSTQYDIDKLSLSENIQYFFCVSAYNSAGESAPCPPVAYTPGDSTPPLPPIGLTSQ